MNWGGGLTAHKTVWSNDCNDSLTLYLDGYVTHLFNNCQLRSFDFCDRGCLSRYMLLKTLSPIYNDLTTAPQFGAGASIYAVSGINFATRNVVSKINVQGDATLRCIYEHENISCNFGFNVFGRSEEQLCLNPGFPCDLGSSHTYGFKGCQGTIYFQYAEDGAARTSGTGNIIPTTSTATNSATITSCGTVDNGVTTDLGPGNTVGVDWSNPFRGDGQQAVSINPGTLVANLVVAQTSNPPVALTDANLNIRSGQAASLVTQKGFVTVDYQWRCKRHEPYISLGVEVEGGTHYYDIAQWGAWLKGGFLF